MIQGISDEDSIAPLFIVDIESDQKKPTEETLLFNEIYMPIIEKKGSFAQWKICFSTVWRLEAKWKSHLKFLLNNG